MAEWVSVTHEQNVVTEHCLHDGATWVAYLQWYLPRTRMRVTYVLATSLLMVKIRQPSHEFTFGVGISFIPYPLVLTPVV
jgi:hypothetical protein